MLRDHLYMIRIKDASPNDVGIIRSLAERIWWPTYSPIIEANQIEYMLKTMYSTAVITDAIINRSQTFLMLSDDNVPKGFASYGLSKEAPNTWKIFKLYVLTEAHKKGYGRRMLDEIISRAKAQGIENLELNVNRHNPALTFYQRIGFQIIREEDIPIGSYWMNDFVMGLQI